jgi:hypothetical protein
MKRNRNYFKKCALVCFFLFTAFMAFGQAYSDRVVAEAGAGDGILSLMRSLMPFVLIYVVLFFTIKAIIRAAEGIKLGRFDEGVLCILLTVFLMPIGVIVTFRKFPKKKRSDPENADLKQ